MKVKPIRQSGPGLEPFLVILTAGIASSCGTTSTAVGDPAEVGSVEVTAPATSLAVGEALQLVGTVLDVAGLPLAGMAIMWTSGNDAVAQVNASGLVTGMAAGAATITAASEGQSGSIDLTVTALPPSAAMSVVTVSAATVEVGETADLTLMVKDAGGGDVTTGGATVAFEASGGTSLGDLSATTDNLDGSYSAVFTATSAGTATTIGATLDGVTVGTSLPTITVSDPPAGIIIFEDDFEGQNFALWDNVETLGGKFAITTDPTHVQAGSAAMQITLNATTGPAGLLNKWFMPGYEEVYLVMDVKIDPAFTQAGHFAGLQGNRTDNQWSSYGQAGVQPDGQNYFQSIMDPGGNGNGPWYLYSYWMDMTCGQPCYGNLIRQDDPRIGHDGTWQRFVRRIRLNTVGQADGLQELWIDGERKIQQLGVRFRDSDILLINDLAFFAYFTGLSGTNYIYVDNVQIRTDAPPGIND